MLSVGSLVLDCFNLCVSLRFVYTFNHDVKHPSWPRGVPHGDDGVGGRWIGFVVGLIFYYRLARGGERRGRLYYRLARGGERRGRLYYPWVPELPGVLVGPIFRA